MKKWPMVPLGDVIRQVTTATHVHADREYPNFGIYSFGRGLFAKPPISGAATSANSLYQVRAGQFIYSRLFAFEGAYGLVSEEFDGCYISNEYPHFDCDRKRLLPEFLATFFKWQKAWERAAMLSTGMGDRRRRIQPEQFLKMAIPLPSPQEQERLIERLDALGAKIDEAKQLRIEADRESAALLMAVIGKHLDAVPFNGTLSEVLRDHPRNGWSPNCDGLETGTAVLSLGAVTGFSYRRDQFKWTGEPTSPTGHYWLSLGDLIMSRSNTPDLVGHAAIYDGLPTPCIYSDLMMKLNIDEDKADKQFVHLVLQCRLVRDFIKANAKGTSPTMKKISQGIVMAIPFPAHLGKIEQQRIGEKILHSRSRLLILKDTQAATGREIEALLPGILDETFRRQD